MGKNGRVKVGGVRSELIGASILAVLLLFIYVPMTQLQVNQHLKPNDFTEHLSLAKVAEEGRIPTAYFLFQALVALVHLLLHARTVEAAAAVVIVASQLATGLVLYFGFFRPDDRTVSFSAVTLRVLGSALTMMVFDVSIFYFIDGHLYFGQVGITSYHNPTIQLLKPIAAWQFLLLVQTFENGIGQSIRLPILLFIATILSGLAKPSYNICILPASAMMLVYSERTAWKERLRPVLIGLWLPSFCLLAWQYFFQYGAPDGVPIIWAPLLVVLNDSAWWTLIPKLVTGLLFPIAVLVLYRRSVLKDYGSVLAWLALGVASLLFYLLAEGPPRTFHGNFGWGLETCGFLLFAASGRLVFLNLLPVLEQRTPWNYRVTACLAVFSLHVAFGIAWYVDNYMLYRHW